MRPEAPGRRITAAATSGTGTGASTGLVRAGDLSEPGTGQSTLVAVDPRVGADGYAARQRESGRGGHRL